MKKLAIVAIVVVILLGVGAVAIWQSRDSSGGSGGDTTTSVALVVVPFLGGQSAEDAGAKLEAAGLRFKVVLAPSAVIGKGRVSAEDPLEGTAVPRGTVVQLTVSSGTA